MAEHFIFGEVTGCAVVRRWFELCHWGDQCSTRATWEVLDTRGDGHPIGQFCARHRDAVIRLVNRSAVPLGPDDHIRPLT